MHTQNQDSSCNAAIFVDLLQIRNRYFINIELSKTKVAKIVGEVYKRCNFLSCTDKLRKIKHAVDMCMSRFKVRLS